MTIWMMAYLLIIMLVGSCKQCDKSCRELDQVHFKKHAHPHSIQRADIYVCLIRDYFQLNSRKYMVEKMRFIKNYFEEIRNTINEMQKTVLQDLQKLIIPVGLDLTTPKHIIQQIENLQKNMFNTLKCNEIHQINLYLDKSSHTNTNLFNTKIRETISSFSKAIKQLQLKFLNNKQLNNPEHNIIRGDKFSKKQQISYNSSPSNDYDITMIKNLQSNNIRGHYNIQVRVDKFVKTINSKEGVKYIFLLSDRNRDCMECKTLKNQYMVVGNTVRIEDCFTREYNGVAQVGVRKQSTITLIDDFKNVRKRQEKHSQTKGKSEQQQSQEQQKKQIKVEKPKLKKQDSSSSSTFEIPQDITKISDISPGQQNLKIYAFVCELICQRNDNMQFSLGDQTGVVRALIPKKYNFVQENQCIYLGNVEATIINQNIVLTLTKQIIKKVPTKIMKINYMNNISQAKWVEEEDDDQNQESDE